MTRPGGLIGDFRRMCAILLITNIMFKKVKRKSDMKRKNLFFVLILIVMLMSGLGQVMLAQNPPPPPGQHNLSGDQPPQGGNAPVGAGTFLLAALGIAYGISKLPGFRNDTRE